MERNYSSRSNIGKTDWHLFGELKLPIGCEHDPMVTAWLTELLKPLGLDTAFFIKVLKSALESVRNAMQPGASRQFEHIHLLVFIPMDHKSHGMTWGFFRIDKIEKAEQNKIAPDHAIEFYLYMEGKESLHTGL